MRKFMGITFLFVFLLSVGFIDCIDNPMDYQDESVSTPVDSTGASWLLVKSWKDDGVRMYTFRATGFFYPAVSSPIMVGIKNKNNWSVGDLGNKVCDNVWEFTVPLENGDKVVNFREKDNWAKLPCLRNTGYFQASSTGGNLAFNVKDGEMSKIGTTAVTAAGIRDTIYIIYKADGSEDTVYGGSNSAKTDTVTITLGSAIKVSGEPINMGNGYWRNTILFSASAVVAPDMSYHPFCIGLPPVQPWNKANKRDLGKMTNGYYPLVVTLKAGQRCKFGVGGDWDKAWADSTALGYWGIITPTGVIGELFVDMSGHIFPGRLVSISIAPPVVLHDTIPGQIIYDTVRVYLVSPSDTTHSRDTTVLVQDLVKQERSVVVSGGFLLDLCFSAAPMRIVANGKPFVIGLPNSDKVSYLGTKRSDWYYPFSVILPVGTYIFNYGGDSASSWADSSKIKGTAWAFKTDKGWALRGTVTKKGDFVPTSLVTPADTVTIVIPGDTVIVPRTDTLRFIRIDTVYLPGKVIHDTVMFNTVSHDTIRIPADTIYVPNTVIDKGTVIDSSKSFLRDTSWLDADSLKGIITEDTIVGARSIHSYLIVSAKGDTVPKADTSTVSNKIYRYRADTVSFVITQYGATPSGVDTVYRFGITTKAFTYSGKGDDSASLTGLSDTSKWAFVGNIGGYFVFDVKLVGGVVYSLNSFGNKGTWAKQEVLLLDPFAVKSGTNCDIVVKGDGVALVKP